MGHGVFETALAIQCTGRLNRRSWNRQHLRSCSSINRNLGNYEKSTAGRKGDFLKEAITSVRPIISNPRSLVENFSHISVLFVLCEISELLQWERFHLENWRRAGPSADIKDTKSCCDWKCNNQRKLRQTFEKLQHYQSLAVLLVTVPQRAPYSVAKFMQIALDTKNVGMVTFYFCGKVKQ